MNWTEYFFEMCKFVSQKSKDPHTKAGCVVVGPDNEVRSTGFNGFPRGVKDSYAEVIDRYGRPEKYIWTEHAERNAIYAAARMGTPLKDCKIYVTGLPCFDCCRAIIQAGITSVYIANYDTEYQQKNNDKYRFDATEQMFKEAGVVLRVRP